MAAESKDSDSGFSVDDVLDVLGGVAEWSDDGSTVVVRDSSWDGRTFEVRLPGAVTYLASFASGPLDARPEAKSDAISYFDLDILEFAGTTRRDGDPIIIDESGPRLTINVPNVYPPGVLEGTAEIFAIDPSQD
ncbi:hypothetical protein H9L21_05110 [Aeromicrobium senzhongii]|uniref:Uncharacterized protein n=1 Tax=Aeromicrobium senzhongii TaxID=2663859 RepID=A0ABX6SV89_9ACTN|nr:hypothetical protein [Aeromicrobium senzhongii]MTB87653.1 hypothetical protein [Aeromicrobium senzhongii]QNL95313.1 hypothetical protein H9L21_05110 [Aeromicrobium senzhongii]